MHKHLPVTWYGYQPLLVSSHYQMAHTYSQSKQKSLSKYTNSVTAVKLVMIRAMSVIVQINGSDKTMDLIEILSNYKFILTNRGRAEAQTFLQDIGVHIEIQKAITACFNNNGNRVDKTAPDFMEIQHDH